MSVWEKRIISPFIVLCLGTMFYANLPTALTNFGNRALKAGPPVVGTVARALGTLVSAFGGFSGLGSRWNLYATPPISSVRDVIEARYADGVTVVLPLPEQSGRTFWQEYFFDFKDGILLTNLHKSRDHRKAYAAYLCRRFPTHDGAPVKAILWRAYQRLTLSPSEAARAGSHVADREDLVLQDVFPCP